MEVLESGGAESQRIRNDLGRNEAERSFLQNSELKRSCTPRQE